MLAYIWYMLGYAVTYDTYEECETDKEDTKDININEVKKETPQPKFNMAISYKNVVDELKQKITKYYIE